MITLVTHNSRVTLPPNNWGEFFSQSESGFPEPSHPPYSVRTLHFVEISQDGNSLLGQLNPQGDSVLHINISFPPRPFPRALTGLSGGTLSPETERDSDKQTQEAESGDKKYRVARTPLPVRVDIPCQDVSVPPDGSKGQRGNTYYLK